MGDAKDIFVSYNRQNEEIKSFVRSLKNDLETRGFSVWLDIDEVSGVTDLNARTGNALHHCKCVIVVLSICYLSSKYCKRELYPADTDDKHIIPIVYESIDRETSESAVGVRYIVGGLEHMHFVPNMDDYSFSLDKMIGTLIQYGLDKSQEQTDSAASFNKGDNEKKDLSAQMGDLHLSDPVSPSAPLIYPPPTPPQPTQQMYQSPPQPAAHMYPPPPPGTMFQNPPPPNPMLQNPPPPNPMFQPPPQTVPMYQYPPPSGPAYQVPPPPSYTDIYPPYQAPVPPANPPVNPGPLPVKATTNTSANPFKPKTKLEANDRRYPYFVCVATIEDVRGDKIKIHFDGWGQEYDYWCTYDMIELHPVGWCAKHGYKLQPPRGLDFKGWKNYLSSTNSTPCEDSMFNSIQKSPPGSLHFRKGMKVEAKDRKYPTLTCVATIQDIRTRSNELLIHFDEWPEDYDYWCKPDSTDIHPPMWCSKVGRKLEPPMNFQGSFQWNKYLAIPENNPAPAHIFTKRQLK